MTPKQRLRTAMTSMIENLKPTVLLTLNLGPSSAPFLTRGLVEHLLSKIESRAHGKRWANFPSDLRLQALAFLEHPDSNPHWHCLLRGSPEIIEVALEVGPSLWRGLVKNGHGDAQAIEKLQAMSRYVTKELYKEWSFEQYIAYAPDRKA